MPFLSPPRGQVMGTKSWVAPDEAHVQRKRAISRAKIIDAQERMHEVNERRDLAQLSRLASKQHVRLRRRMSESALLPMAHVRPRFPSHSYGRNPLPYLDLARGHVVPHRSLSHGHGSMAPHLDLAHQGHAAGNHSISALYHQEAIAANLQGQRRLQEAKAEADQVRLRRHSMQVAEERRALERNRQLFNQERQIAAQQDRARLQQITEQLHRAQQVQQQREVERKRKLSMEMESQRRSTQSPRAPYTAPNSPYTPHGSPYMSEQASEHYLNPLFSAYNSPASMTTPSPYMSNKGSPYLNAVSQDEALMQAARHQLNLYNDNPAFYHSQSLPEQHANLPFFPPHPGHGADRPHPAGPPFPQQQALPAPRASYRPVPVRQRSLSTGDAYTLPHRPHSPAYH